MAPGVLSSACLVTGKPCHQVDHPRPDLGMRMLTTCQFPLPEGELVSIRPTYARFPAQASCLKSQIRVQYI